MVGITNLLFLLFLVELLSWLFVLILENKIVIKYLLIQTVFLLISLVCLLWQDKLLIVAFLFKLGIPPFHVWFINISKRLTKFPFVFIRTMHKLAPFIFFRKALFSSSVIVLTIAIIFAGVLIMESRELFFRIIISSIIHSVWIVLIIIISTKRFINYFILYRTLIILFFMVFLPRVISSLTSEQNTSLAFNWLVLSGLPPFAIFWLKIIVITYLLNRIVLFFRFCFLWVSVISLSVYYRVFHNSLSISIMSNTSFRLLIPLIRCFGFF